MKKIKFIDIPIGWRKLNIGELVKDGDRYLSGTGNWEFVGYQNLPVLPENPVLIRRIRKGI